MGKGYPQINYWGRSLENFSVADKVTESGS